ncbi:metal ABC transporter ATP-binding protein [Peptostreptococcus faecalis]|uniref:metal ABC transporter ATP-binding protein n=1 Tax=Peptostreptococcus faecalis TaxID=2045015 RepID=UPI000C7B55EB|nr:metal ABC transporter ATP-binding protein [Peptostreptococcus faecalis]
MEKIVDVKDVYFKYDKEYILKNFSMEVDKGDYVGVIGSNGSGKSTLIKLILGQINLQKGEIYLFGKDIKNIKQIDRVGYVPQVGLSRGIDFPATVEEIVMMNLYKEIGFLRLPKKEHKEKVKKVLEDVDMLSYKDKKFADLSGGQQQRVIIAKAIVNDPLLLILDEPTTGIDHKSEKLIYDLFEKLHKERKMTIIMISHDLENVRKYTNKVIELRAFCDEEGCEC